MDIFSHGLWTGVVYSRVAFRQRLWAIFFGVAPDMFSFGLLLLLNVLTTGWPGGPPPETAVPLWVLSLYNLTHSLFTWIVLFGLVWAIRRRPWWPVGAGFLHVVLDVPLHEAAFFPTPFLWPITGYTVNGYSWAHAPFLLANYAALAVVYICWFAIDRARRRRSSTGGV